MNGQIDMKALKRMAIKRYLMFFPVLGLAFFLPAWSLKYWEGWLYIFIIAIPVAIFGVYSYKNDPQLLERRMRTKETRKEQKLVIKMAYLALPFVLTIPGLDNRFGWSNIPVHIELIAFVLVLLGYLGIVAVFKENSFASRIIEVESDQKVISTGPYAIVRHPMYTSQILLYLSTPLALGSYWAVIPALIFVLVFIPRILDEEKELLQNLAGYKEYTQKTKYRLLPGVW